MSWEGVMGVSLGFGIGPLRVSTRLRGGRSSTSDLDPIFWLVVILGAAFVAGPWAALESLNGGWGVTAKVLGIAFIVCSILAVASGREFAVYIAMAWFLYLFWQLGYWSSINSRISGGPSAANAAEPNPEFTLDNFVLFLLAAIVFVAVGLVIVAVPLVVSYVAATVVVSLFWVLWHWSEIRSERRVRERSESSATPRELRMPERYSESTPETEIERSPWLVIGVGAAASVVLIAGLVYGMVAH